MCSTRQETCYCIFRVTWGQSATVIYILCHFYGDCVFSQMKDMAISRLLSECFLPWNVIWSRGGKKMQIVFREGGCSTGSVCFFFFFFYLGDVKENEHWFSTRVQVLPLAGKTKDTRQHATGAIAVRTSQGASGDSICPTKPVVQIGLFSSIPSSIPSLSNITVAASSF